MAYQELTLIDNMADNLITTFKNETGNKAEINYYNLEIALLNKLYEAYSYGSRRIGNAEAETLQ